MNILKFRPEKLFTFRPNNDFSFPYLDSNIHNPERYGLGKQISFILARGVRNQQSKQGSSCSATLVEY